jgi:hypothetical protein
MVMRMNTFRRIAWLVAGAAVAFLPPAEAQVGVDLGAIAANRGEPVKGAPYSGEAIIETSQTLADGNKITRTTTTRVYRDSEGRERREESLDPQTGRGADPQRAPTVFIFDPVAGASYMLNVLQHSAMRMPIVQPPAIALGARDGGAGFGPTIQFTPVPGAAGAGAQIPQIIIQQGNHIELTGPGGPAGPVGFASPDPAPRRVERLEPMTIEGLRAEGARTTETIPANRVGNGAPFDIVTESWTSPELKVELVNRHSDPRTGEVTYRLTNLSRSEPDHALFEVPSDYAIQEIPSISGGLVPSGVSVGGRPPR